MPNSKILLIDDDLDFRRSIEIILKSKEYNVIFAPDGKQGFAKAKSENPDLIILDIMLPDGDGFSICRELKETPATFQIPIIILTSISKKKGKSYTDIIAYCHKADEFMKKPVEVDKLLFHIERLLENGKNRLSVSKEKKTVLIADEDADFVAEIEEIISNEYEVFVAASGIEALKISQAFLPDLILLEITLPDKDGFSVCYELKSNPQTHQIPVILVSEIDKELTDSEFARKIALEHKADDFIAKPIEPKQLVKVIKDKLNG